MEYDVIPEHGIRCKNIEYTLGMSVGQAISMMQKTARTIKGVELHYSDDDPLQHDIIINSSQEGFKLYFDSKYQLLKLIEIYDIGKLTLKHCSVVFSTAKRKTTVEQVEQAFGATHPGVYDQNTKTYVLNWRGVSFSFPVESNVQPFQGRGLASLQFPAGDSPILSKICIFVEQSSERLNMPLHLFAGNCMIKNVEFLFKQLKTIGIDISYCAESIDDDRFVQMKPKTFKRRILFGDTCQDVLSALGSPNKIFYKNQDKIKVHNSKEHNSLSPISNNDNMADYFYNYFTLGLDILIDGKTQKIKKFVLHTNFPGHYDFGIYHRCNFSMVLNLSLLNNLESDGDSNVQNTFEVDTFTKWSSVYDWINDPAVSPWDMQVGKTGPEISQEDALNSYGNLKMHRCPVVLNRSCNNNNNNNSDNSPEKNPFPPSICYCFRDIIFEVMQNDHIVSVIAFDS